MEKVRRVFKMRNIARNRIDPERMPLNQASTSTSRDRSPSIDSISTNSSSSSTQTRRSFRSYGSFLPNYFNILRNPFRRSNSSQVRRSLLNFVFLMVCLPKLSNNKWTKCWTFLNLVARISFSKQLFVVSSLVLSNACIQNRSDIPKYVQLIQTVKLVIYLL